MKKFNAFDPVLIRMHSNDEWSADFYDRFDSVHVQHWTITGALIADDNIIPYNEETKHLHGIIGEFIKWKPKKGEPILVRDTDDERWTLRIFIKMHNRMFVATSEPDASHLAVKWNQAKPYTNPFKE